MLWFSSSDPVCPPPELQVSAARLKGCRLAKNRSGRWLEGGRMWWTLSALPVQRGPRIWQM